MWQRQNALINTENDLSYCIICIFIDCLSSKSIYSFCSCNRFALLTQLILILELDFIKQ